MIYIICDRPAQFITRDRDVFDITKKDVGKPIEAPAWILETYTFGILTQEKAIQVLNELPAEEQPKKKPKKGDAE